MLTLDSQALHVPSVQPGMLICLCCGNGVGQEWVRFGEGQHTCLDCLATIVRNTADAQPLYDDVLALYAHLSMPLPTRPPLMLVRPRPLLGE